MNRIARLLSSGLLVLLMVMGLVMAAEAAQTSGTSITMNVEGRGTVNGTTAKLPIQILKTFTLENGTGASQAQTVYATTSASLSASATTTYDLAGTLTDFTGATITFTKVKLIYVFASASNTNNVHVGGVGANAFLSPFGANTDLVKVPPGGALLLTAPDANGFSVTAGTGDLLQVANGGAGTSVTYDLVIIGV